MVKIVKRVSWNLCEYITGFPTVQKLFKDVGMLDIYHCNHILGLWLLVYF